MAFPRTLRLAVAAVCAASSAALAAEVHEITPGGDLVNGTLEAPGELDRIPFRLVEGSFLTLQVKAAKGSPLLPEVTMLGTDRRPDVAAAAALVTAKKGNAVALKNFPVDETGLRWLEVRGGSGTTGGWQLKMKVKLPKKAAGGGAISGGALTEGTTWAFTAPGGAVATLAVSAGKKSAAVPVFSSLVDPTGKAVLVDDITTTKKGFLTKNLALPRPGLHVLRFTAGEEGAWTAKASFKLPKFLKRTLLDTDIVTDPVLVSITPDSADTSQYVQGTLSVDFGRPGAVLVFRKTPTVVTVLSPQVTVTEGEAQFGVSIASFQKGAYDVEFVNPDGGRSVLDDAFTVVNAPASPTEVVPSFGYDNQVMVLTLKGTYFSTGAGISLVRGSDTIQGTAVIGGATQMQATFDLRGRAIGAWDLVVQNLDATPGVLPAAFDLRNAPPTLSAMSPTNNLAGELVEAVITGADLDPTPSVLLRRQGAADIPGSSTALVGSTEVHADFDTAGVPFGNWDLVLTNPDGQSAVLTGVLRTQGPVADPVKVISITGTLDAPPAVAWNGTRDEFAVAWVETGSAGVQVQVMRVDTEGAPIGTPKGVSTGSSTLGKRDVAIGWDPVNDEYLVVWSELHPITVAGTHPSYGYSSVFGVVAQRFRGSDLTSLNNNILVTSRVLFSGWYMDEFNNTRASLCWNPVAKEWIIGFQQEWSKNNVNNYGTDDYDVLTRTLQPVAGTMGTSFTGIAFSSGHEGDPDLAWDPGANALLVAYTTGGSASDVAVVVNGASVASDSTASLVDPRIVVDPDTKRALVTWTRLPATGNRSVHGILVDAASPGSPVGSAATIGSGNTDHFMARPLYNPTLEQGMVLWTRKDSSGDLSVRIRRVDTTGTGLALLGVEDEASGGSGGEGIPVAVLSGDAGESVALWVGVLDHDADGSYRTSVAPGTWRGEELWFRRYK